MTAQPSDSGKGLAMEITKDIRYIGVDDHDIDLFEGQYEVENGMAYNSYVILDEKIAVMDTVEAHFGEQWLENLSAALNGNTPDYLVLHHMEPDHSANIVRFMEQYPHTTIVGSAKAFQLLEQFYGETYSDRQRVVKDKDTLSLGRHELTFFTAPMVHWPEVIMSYDAADKVLFSADAFGKFGANDYDDPEGWACEARRYYFGIVGKYGAQVQALLKKLADKEIRVICSLHGPVLTEDIGYYLDTYNTWSSYGVETEGVAICYTSVYGHTKAAAELLERKLLALGCPKVAVNDLARCDMAEAVGYGSTDSVLDVVTIEDYTDMVKKVYDQFHCDWTIGVDSDDGGAIGLSANAFEGTIPNISASATSVGMTRYGDQIIADLTTDTARKYAEWFYDLYSYGVINPEFYVNTLDTSASLGLVGNGNLFTWTGRADGTEQFVDYLDENNQGGYSSIVPPIYAYEGQPHEYPTSVSMVDNKQFVITTSCEQVDLVANYLNFGYTEGGYEYYNWGVEGETFYIDDEGGYHYTDFVWNNPYGANFMMGSAMAIMGQLPRLDEHGKLSDGYTEKQLAAQATWTADGEELHNIPSKAGLTTEESNSIINQVNDVLAVASEWGLRFYTGSLEINDANWADFQDALVNAGINDVQATYQAAYESYLRGERDNIEVASTGGDDMGGPPPDMP